MLGVGMVTGPPFGSYMSAAYGFQTTMDSLAIMCLGTAVTYFVFGGGVQALKQTRLNYSQ